jgi:hypothetical protein
MTLGGFAKKWAGNNLPDGIAAAFGSVIAVLEHAGLSKEEISELAGDVLDLSHHMETPEGKVELASLKEEILG